MKKLFILMLMAITFMAINAQNEAPDASLDYNSTWAIYTGVATDTIGANDSIWTRTIEKFTDSKIFVYLYMDIDSIGGTAGDVAIYLQNKVFDAEAFTDIDTVTWSGNVDTTFVYETATSDIADRWRVFLQGASDGFAAEIQRCDLKFVK